MRIVQTVMGIPISIDIPGASTARPHEAAFGRLHAIDAEFSTYKPDSPVSRFRDRTLTEQELSDEHRMVLDACRAWSVRTGGYFDAFYSGTYDPSGYVKGWAIAEAGSVIAASGHGTYCINAGGDIVLRSDNGYVWHIGLQHPTERESIMGTVSATNRAVATSGTYERGAHIIDPHDRSPALQVLSATVIADDIIAADVYATALCAMGFERAKAFVATMGAEYRVILVDSGLNAFDSAR